MSFYSIRPSSIALMPLLSILCILYFAYHLINGDRGIKAYLKLNQKIIEAEKDLDFLDQKRKKREQLIDLLSPFHIDPEMAEERIRAMLGYGYKDEKVIFFDFPMNASGQKGPSLIVLSEDE
jgi:cell division protein FtsB